MKHIKKIIATGIIIIIFSPIFTISAKASGFIFHWEPLVANDNLTLNNTVKEVFIKNLSIPNSKIPVSDDYINKFALFIDQEAASAQKKEQKSIAENVKIKFIMSNSLLTDKNPIYSDSDDEQISKIIDALTSLIYDDSKSKPLETIGEIIEPQINFYFEF